MEDIFPVLLALIIGVFGLACYKIKIKYIIISSSLLLTLGFGCILILLMLLEIDDSNCNKKEYWCMIIRFMCRYKFVKSTSIENII